MNLVDVKNALETIVRLNPGLSKDKLVVLLRAANWEDASIQEAVTVFAGMQHELDLPHVDAENLLEKTNPVSPVVTNTPQVEKKQIEIKEELNLPHVDNENLLTAQTPAQKTGVWPFTKTKPEVKTETVVPAIPVVEKTPVPKVEHLPEGLPLKPFDSSEHVWTFSEYKEKFHGGIPGTPLPQKKEDPVKQVVKVVPPPVPQVKIEPKPAPQPVVVKKEAVKNIIIEIDEPLNGSDLSLLVVVSFLFLVIILLLGYMYSNGRLFL